jgi:hypothetical protein
LLKSVSSLLLVNLLLQNMTLKRKAPPRETPEAKRQKREEIAKQKREEIAKQNEQLLQTFPLFQGQEQCNKVDTFKEQIQLEQEHLLSVQEHKNTLENSASAKRAQVQQIQQELEKAKQELVQVEHDLQVQAKICNDYSTRVQELETKRQYVYLAQTIRQVHRDVWECIVGHFIPCNSYTHYSLLLVSRGFYQVFSNPNFRWHHLYLDMKPAFKSTAAAFWEKYQAMTWLQSIILYAPSAAAITKRTVPLNMLTNLHHVTICFKKRYECTSAIDHLMRKFTHAKVFSFLSNCYFYDRSVICQAKQEYQKDIVYICDTYGYFTRIVASADSDNECTVQFTKRKTVYTTDNESAYMKRILNQVKRSLKNRKEDDIYSIKEEPRVMYICLD